MAAITFKITMAKRDYYEVLGVAKGASADEIKKAVKNWQADDMRR